MIEGQWEGCCCTAGPLTDLYQITWILLNATSERKYPAAADLKGTYITEQQCFCSRVVILFTFPSVWEEMEGKLATCEYVNGRNQTHLSPLACTHAEFKELMRELCFSARVLF